MIGREELRRASVEIDAIAAEHFRAVLDGGPIDPWLDRCGLTFEAVFDEAKRLVAATGECDDEDALEWVACRWCDGHRLGLRVREILDRGRSAAASDAEGFDGWAHHRGIDPVAAWQLAHEEASRFTREGAEDVAFWAGMWLAGFRAGVDREDVSR